MPTKVNPFKPNSPAPVGMFAGRLVEINALEKGLYQTKNGKDEHFLITGERGIGKSSLLAYTKPLANGDIKSPDYDRFNFVTIQLSISERTELVTLIKLIERNLKRELGKVEIVRNFLEETWQFVQRIKVMDSGLDQAANTTEDPDLLMDDFAYSLAETCKRIVNPYKDESARDGVVIFIDEADNACPELHLGYFIKTVTEKLNDYGCNNVMFVAAGLTEVKEKLVASHPSSLRVFKELKIKELKLDDRHYVVERGMEEANEINEEKTSINTAAIKHISTLSEGYPHFLQQFAYSAFDVNTDGEITEDDVLSGAFDQGGALDAIGSRYYESAYREQIKTDEYREVLSIMSEKMNSWVTKAFIRESFSGTDQTLNNALQALTNRKIILRNSSRRGEYRLQQKGFALWIKLFGERAK